MATVTLKNVPEKLVERLKVEPRENRRSLNQETLSAARRTKPHVPTIPRAPTPGCASG